MTTYRRVLVLGGARSGKSRIAQGLAERTRLDPHTHRDRASLDEEMRQRISHHRAGRDASWLTREVPDALAEAVGETTGPGKAVLVDCLTLWLSNLLLAGRDPDRETETLIAAVRDAKGPLILVSNEVGHGVVPATPLGRSFRDAQGRLNQRMAEACDAVILIAAGCPLLLKPASALDVTLA